MYFPVGWPKSVILTPPGDKSAINHICCDAVKILVAAAGNDFLGVWYANPLIPIVFYQRPVESIVAYGTNRFIVWKPDSRQLVILTNAGVLLLYQIDFDADGSGILTQVDPPSANLKRDSAELFIKENIPRLSLRELRSIRMGATITTVCCISLTELLIATEKCELIRIQWAELEAESRVEGAHDTINLRNIPFFVNQNCHLKSLPSIGDTAFVAAMEYSPFIGGCAIVFSDNRAAFLIAIHLRFETQNMHGFWVPEVEDATVCSVNHKFRLLAYGRFNSDVAVYAIEDTTGGSLEFSHCLSLNSSVIPVSLGAVNELKWSPDGCVLAVTWSNGGISLWSTFGALLMSSLSWDFGLQVDLVHNNPLRVNRLEWSTEGYQLFMTCKKLRDRQTRKHTADVQCSNVLQLNFVKSTLAMNPCMASNSHVLLQGDDTLYLNQGDNLEKIYFGSNFTFPNNQCESPDGDSVLSKENEDNMEVKKSVNISSMLSESKYWSVLQLPLTYAATNWPIRYSAIDAQGLHIAVAGRTGLAHYSILTKKWKLFGNESQEKDFVVSGGLFWWKGFIVMGCYSLLDRTDEIRCYPEECKLDNQFGNKIQVRAPVILLNMFQDQVIALTADGIVSLFVLKKLDAFTLSVKCVYEVDVKSICIHPACIVSLTVTNLRNDLTCKPSASTNSSSSFPASNPNSENSNGQAETIIVNVCGRILMIQRDSRSSVINSLMASCLASCVECFWLSNSVEKSPMRDCLWLYSGAHGMRVWLPILPPATSGGEQVGDAPPHRTFMSKRIMLAFPLKLYPLVILFDNVIVLGVENETTLYTSEVALHFSLPFCILERKSQVYLHKILRQLIKRNLGYSAWEIAKSCRALPYFPHSLELLLHEVLEEEATSKEPIPDALLPSILDFIREFPVYLQTIVQCARKTEIALWPYLFSKAGKPKDLFQQCLQSEELETAASYLIILQNLEPSVISKQYATLLLDIALQNNKWELAKDLIRFLKAIDPNEIDSPRSSMVVNVKIAPPLQAQSQVNQNPEVFNLILGPIARERSFSTTVTSNLPKEKKGQPNAVTSPTPASNSGGVTSTPTAPINEIGITSATSNSGVGNASFVMRRKSERSYSTKERKETFCIDIILQRHARQLLQKCKLVDLGYMSAFLDFHLVTWLLQETDHSARLDDFVAALICLHEELKLPAPFTKSKATADGDTPSPSSTTTTLIDYAQLQRQFLLDNRSAYMQHTSSQTSESGYFSLALMDTPTSTNNDHYGQAQIASIKKHEEMRYASLSGDGRGNVPVNYEKSRSNSQISLENTRFRRLYSMHDDISAPAGFPLGLNCISSTGGCEIRLKILPDKLAIKMRYLLQLFIEANCTDYALVLSVLLQDAASIGRIINVVIRSKSLPACNRIEIALKRLTQWSSNRDCLYRLFMISLQPHIYILNQFIMSASNMGGNASVNCNPEQVDVDETDTEDCNVVDGLLNLSQSSRVAVAKTKHHWSLDKLPNHDGSRISRQTSIDSTINATFPKNNNRKNSSIEQLGRKEPSACHVM